MIEDNLPPCPTYPELNEVFQAAFEAQQQMQKTPFIPFRPSYC